MAGELSLLGEFPEASHSRAVLEAGGSGERTFSTTAAQAGGAGALPSGTLSPLLATLQDKRVLAADVPCPSSRTARTGATGSRTLGHLAWTSGRAADP